MSTASAQTVQVIIYNISTYTFQFRPPLLAPSSLTHSIASLFFVALPTTMVLVVAVLLLSLFSATLGHGFNLFLDNLEELDQLSQQLSFQRQQQLKQQNFDIAQQPSARNPKTNVKLRQLQWGKINFLHTTDTHAWYAGHLNQKNYGADWGDYISFVKHLRDYADSIGVDLIVVDSGDKHDGNGLSDASEVNGEVSTRFFIELDFDLLTIGNHELYLASSSQQEYELVVGKFKDKYLAANVQYLVNDEWVDFGAKYKIFQTKNQNLTVLSLGFLFDFKKFNALTKVTSVEQAIQQPWFHEVLQQNIGKIDLIVVVGHLPVQIVDEFPEIVAIHKAIRQYYPNIAIQFFGGHSHIRDYTKLDNRSVALQSGRYCETVGFLGVSFPEDYQESSQKGLVEFNRRYIDFNLYSFHTHSNKTYDTFPTKKGKIITKNLDIQRHLLNITEVYGYVPQSYLIIDNSYPSTSNLYTFLEDNILPRLVSDNKKKRENKTSRVVLINSGSIRYDLYKGAFTKDTMYIVSPFQNKWLYLPKLPLWRIKMVVDILNGLDYIFAADKDIQSKQFEQNNNINVDLLAPLQKLAYNSKAIARPPLSDIKESENLAKGYVTCDDDGCDGDDTPHIPYSPEAVDSSPNIVRSVEVVDHNTEEVDFVFYDFLQSYIVWALDQTFDGSEQKKGEYEFKHYGGETVGEMLKDFVIENWGV